MKPDRNSRRGGRDGRWDRRRWPAKRAAARRSSFLGQILACALVAGALGWTQQPFLSSLWAQPSASSEEAASLSAQPSVAPKDVALPEPSVYYSGCNEVRAAGAAPLYSGSPGYREGMDGDGDGIACEPYR
jgi:hypothetical protein